MDSDVSMFGRLFEVLNLTGRCIRKELDRNQTLN